MRVATRRGIKEYRVTYSVDGIEYVSVTEGLDSLDARRKFERKLGFPVVKVEQLSSQRQST